MAIGQIIGRVSIKVLPDTSNFRRDLERDLNKIERGLEVTAKVKLDTGSARKEADRIKRELDDKLKQLTIRINLDDQDSVQAAIARIQAELRKLDEVEIKVDLDRGALEAKLAELKDRLNEIRNFDIRVNINNQESVGRSIAALRAKLEELREVTINVDMDEETIKAKLKELEKRLNEIRTIEIRVDGTDEGSLRHALAKIDAELAKHKELAVDINVDPASLKAARHNIQKALTELETVRLELDRTAANNVQRRIEEIVRGVKFPVKVDPESERKARLQIEGLVDKMESLRATIRPEMDDRARRQAEREIERLKDQVEEIKSSIEAEVNEGKKHQAEAALAFLSRARTVLLVPKVSRPAVAAAATTLAALSGGRVLRNTLRNLSDFMKNLDQNVPIIGTLATAIMGLSMWAATAASNLFSLSSSLASIGPAALLLPGILGGVAIGVAASVAAFRDFNTIFPDVKGKLTQLQDLISKNFWAKAQAPFRSLINDLFPRLLSGLGKVSTQLGSFFGNLAKSLKSILGPDLELMFKGLSDSITVFATHTDSIVGIMRTLGKIGAEALPRLADAFGNLLDRFDAFLEKADKDGRLKGWIDTAIEAMKDLGAVVKNTFGIFAGISRAATAAGGSTLDSLAKTLERIHKAVDSLGFQTGLTTFLRSAHEGLDRITEISGPAFSRLFTEIARNSQYLFPLVGKVIGDVFKMVADILSDPAFSTGLNDMFLGFAVAMEALQPLVKPMAEALGELMKIMGSLAMVMAPLVTAVLTPMLDLFTKMGPQIREAIGLLGGSFLKAIEDSKPGLKGFDDALMGLVDGGIQMLKDILPAVNELWKQMADEFGPSLVQVMKDLKPLMKPLGEAFAQMLRDCKPLVTALGELFRSILPLIKPAVDSFLQHLPQFIEIFAQVLTIVSQVITLISQLVTYSMPLLTGAMETFGDMFGGVLAGISSLLDGIPSLMSGTFRLFIDLIRGDWTALWEDIKNIVSGAKDIVIGLALVMGRGIVTALWNSIKNSFPEATKVLTEGLGGLLGNIRDWAASALGAVGGLMKDIGIALRDGGKQWIAALGYVPIAVSDAFVNAGTWLLRAGYNVVSGLVTGMWNGLRGLVPGVLSGIKNAIVGGVTGIFDIHSPSRVMAKLGGFVGIGFANGIVDSIKASMPSIRRSLGSVVNAASGLSIVPPSVADGLAGSLAASIDAAGSGQPIIHKTLTYNAAPGSSLGSEEDLFSAAGRLRMVL